MGGWIFCQRVRKTNASWDSKMLQHHLLTNHISALCPYTVGYQLRGDQCWDLRVGCKGLKFGAGDAPRLLRDSPAGGTAMGCEPICGPLGVCGLRRELGGPWLRQNNALHHDASSCKMKEYPRTVACAAAHVDR